ncbi:hypothetical protein [Paraflavitalea pollutisoli]|uniref:hypothetical protein n=1 Tax=Paraflavitalea pollutisoli TaxID=3034143 RepID=UPI0023EC8AC0|nr:hypothetical protein [Paraflavitalea sp. H1-2-19X]
MKRPVHTAKVIPLAGTPTADASRPLTGERPQASRKRTPKTGVLYPTTSFMPSKQATGKRKGKGNATPAAATRTRKKQRA